MLPRKTTAWRTLICFLSSMAMATALAATPDLVVPSGKYTGYLISTLQPSQRMTGETQLAPDGTFDYEGANGVKFTGKVDLSNPAIITGSGMTSLPKMFGFLQFKYPDGTSQTPLNFRGHYFNGVFKGSYSSAHEQGLFYFVSAMTAPALDAAPQDGLGVFLMPPNDLVYPATGIAKQPLIVLPGNFSSNAEFAEEVSAVTLANTAEAELQRAGFDVVERGDFGSAVDTLRKAYSVGVVGPSVSELMQMGRLKKVKWVVILDMPVATKLNQPLAPQTPATVKAEQKSQTDKFIALLEVAGELGDTHLVDLWKLKVNYRVLDSGSGKQLHQGSVEDILLTMQTISKTLVSQEAKQRDVTYHMMMRRIVQMAVAQINGLR